VSLFVAYWLVDLKVEVLGAANRLIVGAFKWQKRRLLNQPVHNLFLFSFAID
jgi:hypothetical protein